MGLEPTHDTLSRSGLAAKACTGNEAAPRNLGKTSGKSLPTNISVEGGEGAPLSLDSGGPPPTMKIAWCLEAAAAGRRHSSRRGAAAELPGRRQVASSQGALLAPPQAISCHAPSCTHRPSYTSLCSEAVATVRRRKKTTANHLKNGRQRKWLTLPQLGWAAITHQLKLRGCNCPARGRRSGQ